MSAVVAASAVHKSRKLLILTDIHIRGENQKIIGLDPLEKFELALIHALHVHKDAAALIITGDLTHSGKVEEYRRLNDALQLARNARLPYHLMVGNHDNRDNFLQVFPDTPLTADGHVQQVLDFGTHKCILLDTLDGPPFSHSTHHGVLCSARLSWLEEQLQEAQAVADEQSVIVCIHHPPFMLGIPGMDAIRLKNDEACMDLLCRYPCVSQIICGHMHRTISGTCRGKAYAVFKSPCHQLPMDMDSEDSSLSTAEPGAYGIVLLPNKDHIIVHTEDFELAPIGKNFSCRDAMPDVY